jgi:hypothetical protein
MPSISNEKIMSRTAENLSQRAQGIMDQIGCNAEAVLCSKFGPEVWNDLTLWPTDYFSQPSGHPGIPRVVSITEDDDCEDTISDICEIRHCSFKRSPSAEDSNGSSTGTDRMEVRRSGSEDTPTNNKVSKSRSWKTKSRSRPDVLLTVQRESIPQSEYPIVVEDDKMNRYGYV